MIKASLVANRVTPSIGKFKIQFEKLLTAVITERTEALFQEVHELLSSPSPVDASRSSYGTKAYTAGTGTEIPALNTKQAVHPHTGRMRDNLQQAVNKQGTSVGGEVGYSSAFAPENPGRLNELKWPEKTSIIYHAFSLLPEKNYPGDDITAKESPMKYVPKILLGQKMYIGRNVLRLALIRDIQGNTTKTALERAVGSFVTSFVGSAGGSLREEGLNPRALGTSPRQLARKSLLDLLRGRTE